MQDQIHDETRGLQQAVAEYKAVMHCNSVLHVIPRNVLDNLLSGYCVLLKAGISLLTIDPESPDDLVHISPKDSSTFRPFCRELRKYANMNERCLKCDEARACEIINGLSTSEDVEYSCHMGLTDLRLPIFVNGRKVGALLAGQIIRDRGQLEKVLENLEKTGLPEKDQARLSSLLLTEDVIIPPSEVTEYRTNFCEFAHMLNTLAHPLYEAKEKAANDHVMAQLAWVLTNALSMERGQWWQSIAAAARIVLEAFGIQHFYLLTRDRSRYVLQVDENGHIPDEPMLVPAGDLGRIEENSIVWLGNKHKDLLRRLGERMGQQGKPTMLYHIKVRPSRGPIAGSAILLYPGPVMAPNTVALKEVCEFLAVRIAMAALFFEIEDTHVSHAKRAAQQGHSVRTSLQHAFIAIDALLRDELDPANVRRWLNKCWVAINQALEYSKSMYDDVLRRREQIDVNELCRQTVDVFRTQADQRGCPIFLRCPAEHYYVLSRPVDLRLAFSNILDNAVKYSWSGRYIRVQVKKTENDTVTIAVTNYGIGIPPEKLNEIGSWAYRATVQDTRARNWGVTREGGGIGLATSIDILEADDGSLQITSVPADDHPRCPGEEYHRYYTTVTIALPLST